MTEHPITPSPELVQAFLRSNPSTPAEMTYEQFIATRFARWGADQELEACCEYLTRCAAWEPEDVQEMRDLRRPKPKSQAEEALETLHSMRIDPAVINGINVNANVMTKYDIIRAALIRLRELEGGND